MRQLIALILLVPLFALADAEAAALAAVRDLGAVNGQALACGHRATAARAKALMLDRAPRTYAYGEAFQDGTNTAFNAQTRMAPEACPTAPAAIRPQSAIAADPIHTPRRARRNR